jgi:hypothetical protein
VRLHKTEGGQIGVFRALAVYLNLKHKLAARET